MTDRPRARHRFMVEPGSVGVSQIRFPPPVARQMRRVLRLAPGDRVLAFDGTGLEYTVALVSLRDESAVGVVEAQRQLQSEPRLHLTLCQALLPREKFELVLQKATEVGVGTFVPLATERSLVPARVLDDTRFDRWRRIVQEAAEQAGRARVPALEAPRDLADALTRCAQEPALFAWERETSLSLRQAFVGLERRLRDQRLTLFIGPEGGFTSAEALSARAAGAITVSLGPRTLRAETAGPVLAALALYQAGDLEPPR